MRNIDCLKKLSAAFVLALVLAALNQIQAEAATIIHSNNPSKTSAGTESASGARRLTSSFVTSTDVTFLTSVTLMLANTGSGAATLSVYSNSTLSPGTLVGTLTSPSSYASSLAATTFTASSTITLQASTTYWVVLQANSGTFAWSWTGDNTGDGSRYMHTWGESDDSGTTWHTYNVFPLQMSVVASTTAITTSQILLTSDSYTISEGGGSATITVTRTGDTSAAATVDYTTLDGTSSNRTDYNTAVGTISFAAGETSKTIPIFITDDTFVEGNETITVTLGNAANGTLASPSSATITITDNDVSAPTLDAIDTDSFFVRQHYVDFLNREPDSSGLAFWTNQMTNCGASDVLVCHVNASAAFYVSIEFQETGDLVYRTWGAAFGPTRVGSTVALTFAEFLPDRNKIASGVIVGNSGWETLLEANKVAYFNEFVTRSVFTAAYPSTISNAAYVDALNTNAGEALSTSERNQLIAELTAGTKTRAEVLRAVVEDSDFESAQFNKAFVLMQYFGYLQRNPNDAPDSDFSGYSFWLNKLNSFGGNYVNAEMVKAFITSTEYRARFGP